MSTKRKCVTASDELPPGKRQAIADWVDTSNRAFPSAEICEPLPIPESSLALADNETMSQASSHEASQPRTRSVRTQSVMSTISGKLTSSSTRYDTQLRMRYIYDADKNHHISGLSNMQELRNLLSQERSSPELMSEMHMELRTILMNAATEDAVMVVLKQHLLKEEWKYQPHGSILENAPWNQHVPITPELSPQLSDPRPDMAYGWKEQAFQGLSSSGALDEVYIDQGKRETQTRYQDELRSYQAPSSRLFWPVVTIEGKGPRGTLDEAHLQNAYNAAVMLNNIFQLKRKAHRPLPYDQALVFTVNLVYYNIELTCHWVSAGEDGQDVFLGKVLRCWTMRDDTAAQWNLARMGIRNCIEWARNKALPDIRSDLAAVREIQRQQGPRQISSIPSVTQSFHRSFLADRLDTISMDDASNNTVGDNGSEVGEASSSHRR